ncbi:MAG: hypothetical protein HFE58_07120 [Firmicutes bacterium]|nr:hypothetical protein [Bacillota bacterium]
MWKDDNDKIMDLLYDIQTQNIKSFPAICPICGEKQAHLYFYRYAENTNKGGGWVWCSKCKHYAHFLIKIPEYWENFSKIKFEKLAAYPDYIEKEKNNIDNWNNKLLCYNNNRHSNTQNNKIY